MDAVIPKLEAVLAENPDLAYSRVVCPRKLAENTAYHAFLIPTFEAGRRAGLGLDLGDIPATMSAWDRRPRPEGQSFPYLSPLVSSAPATTGDFETLVRLLDPEARGPARRHPRDGRAGSRARTCAALDKPELGGILKLGGALQPPTPVPPSRRQIRDLGRSRSRARCRRTSPQLINLPDDYQAAGDPDPIITPPLYGTWHALTKRVLTERDGTPIAPNDNWVHRLNLDPRFRVAAGIGTRVIQDQQEKFMDAAWEQIGKVLEAQRRIRLGQFGLLVEPDLVRPPLDADARRQPATDAAADGAAQQAGPAATA